MNSFPFVLVGTGSNIYTLTRRNQGSDDQNLRKNVAICTLVTWDANSRLRYRQIGNKFLYMFPRNNRVPNRWNPLSRRYHIAKILASFQGDPMIRLGPRCREARASRVGVRQMFVKFPS